jgi:hypothetical protein
MGGHGKPGPATDKSGPNKPTGKHAAKDTGVPVKKKPNQKG